MKEDLLTELARCAGRTDPVRLFAGRGALPDGPDPHLHEEWELKFFAGRPAELIPPRTIHAVTTDHLGVFTCAGGKFSLLWRGRPVREAELPEHSPAETLCELFRAHADDGGALARHLGGALLAAVRQAVRAARAVHPDPKRDLCENAMDFLRRNYFRAELGIPDAAAYLGCSAQYLNRKFSARYGHGVRRALIELRLARACELLTDGGYTVADAARLTGWNCPFYFSNSFRRFYGLPPGRVRKTERMP